MTFHPNMQTTIEGISVIGGLRCRAWTGAIADFWQVSCAPEARGEYVSQAPRLVVIMDRKGGGDIELRLPSSGRGAHAATDPRGRGNLHYIPAGVPVCSRAVDLEGLSHLDIHFDMKALARHGLDDVEGRGLAEPRLSFCDQRVSRLARLVAAECVGPGTSCSLYGDGLIAAIVGALLEGAPPPDDRPKGRLTPGQLRRVTDFIRANCTRTIRLQELAALAGLSPSYFSAAFKASTGLPPHKWQMRARIEQVKRALETDPMPLADVAAATGFADQAHLTRVFRQVVGTTPGAWMRDRAA